MLRVIVNSEISGQSSFKFIFYCKQCLNTHLTVAKSYLMCVLFFPMSCIVVNVIYGSIFANVSKKLNRHFKSYNSFKMWSSIHLSFVLIRANLGLA